MRKIFLLTVFLCFSLQGCCPQKEVKAITPPAALGSYTWEFGKVREGEILRHKFVLTNETEKTLNIKEINTSCGCTVSKARKNTLPSGDSTEIEVEFNSKGYSGSTEQFVYVHTDSRDKPILKFIIKAEVVKEK